MSELASRSKVEALDKDLEKLSTLEEATNFVARGAVAPGVALVFLVGVALLASVVMFGQAGAVLIVAAVVIAAYMALNIGANDVANNVGPAVGARVLTLGGALVMAAVFESAGVLIAGGDVVRTIASGIVAPEAVGDPQIFVRAMMAALLAAALWINLATWIGAPVSTTHSVVGGVMGAGIAAAGFGAVNWGVMSAIAASWVLSPVMGGLIAASFLYFIKTTIIYQDDKIAAARRWVPLLIALMAGAFAAYLALKGLSRLVRLSGLEIVFLGLGAALLAWAPSSVLVRRRSEGMENRNQSLRRLFAVPLICSAALLSFAHGANDVANAVGPVAAIIGVIRGGEAGGAMVIPFWIMLIGAAGISLGLLLYGPKLIRIVGRSITRLNPIRAFCVALSAAVTVIVATWFGMPISSTHTAVGAVFGVGFLREWYVRHSPRRQAYIARKARRSGMAVPAEAQQRGGFLRRRHSARQQRRKLVRRAHLNSIAAAWVATVPSSALLSASIFFILALF